MNQLFRCPPDYNLLAKIVLCFNLRDINDKTEFTKQILIACKCVEKMNNLIPELTIIYVPCKAKIYLQEIKEKRCITILKHFLKFFKYKLKRREKIDKKKKILYYHITSIDTPIKCQVKHKPVLIDFN